MIKSCLNFKGGWFIFISTIVILRLALTGDRDILALNSPHDEFWYIHTAFNNIWGSSYSYSEMSFMHLPIYSAWLDFLRLLGIPTRFAIDVGWLLAAGYIAFATQRLTRMAWLAALIFVFLAFHPYTIPIFDRALAETFLAVVSAAVIGAGIELWNCRDENSTFRRRFAFCIYVFGFAVAYHTRKEGIVLAAPLLVLASWSLIYRERWWSGFGKQRLAISLLLAPLLSTFFLGAILASGNYLKWGVLARYELAAPGYERAIGALNSIDVGRTPRYITVTNEILSLAYKESPTFRELQPFMEGPTGKQWVAIAKPFTSAPGEIANGWFYWALRAVAARAGWHSDAKVADSKYAAVADELEKAFASGRLKKKESLLSSFIDPDIGKWMPELPQSFFNILQLVMLPKLQHLGLPRENASESQFDQYVAITGRRSMPSRYQVNGWIIMPPGTLVGLGTGNSTFSWERLEGMQRPDVPGGYPFTASTSSLVPPTELHLLSPDGRKGSVALTSLKAGSTSTFSGAVQAHLGIDRLESSSRSQRSDQWLARLCIAYEWIGYLFCLATVSSILAMVTQRKRLSGNVFVFVFVLLIVAVAARVALFGILDASSWNGIQVRYVLPVVPAFACMGALALAFLSGLFQKPELEVN
jgi:hypothetical protein